MRTQSKISRRPTAGELDILRVLWLQDGCTVREVHDLLRPAVSTGYTTTLKLLQVMHAKGLVVRDDAQRAHVYRAAVSKEHTQKRFLLDLVQKMFEGSSSKLVLQALGSQPPSRQELDEIRSLLDRLDSESPQ
ncbi:MAG: BlaI/MecI/CopY family transcriptional regulator [Rhodanobacter sp.]